MKVPFAIGIMWAVFPVICAGQETDALQESMDHGRKEIQALGLGIAIIDKNGDLKTMSSGEMWKGKPLNSDAVFQIGSITKTYTAVLVLKLVEQGKLNLDDKLERWYPDLPAAKQITIRQLLNHTSGMDDIFQQPGFARGLFMNPRKTWTIEGLLEKIGDAKFEPGEKWAYSSSGYLVITGILEKVSGLSYRELLHQEITTPLQLPRTYVGGQEKINQPVVHAMIDINGDDVEDDLSALVPMTGFLSASSGAGGIVSNPGDVAKFVHALMHDKLVKVESLKQWVERSDGNQHGLGILKLEIEQTELLGHRGNSGGFSCSAWYSPRHDTTIVVCSNKNGIHLTPIVKRVLHQLNDNAN